MKAEVEMEFGGPRYWISQKIVIGVIIFDLTFYYGTHILDIVD